MIELISSITFIAVCIYLFINEKSLEKGKIPFSKTIKR